MLAISTIWLCVFCENASILDKMPILGQAPRRNPLKKIGERDADPHQYFQHCHIESIRTEHIFFNEFLLGILVFDRFVRHPKIIIGVDYNHICESENLKGRFNFLYQFTSS